MSAQRVPLYQQLQVRIESLIRDRALRPNSRLPSINELADTFDANPLTIRRALSELSARGIIESRHGVGTFVAPPRPRTLCWVTAVDIFHGDVSPFYTGMLREASKFLRELGYEVEPIWVGYEGTTVPPLARDTAWNNRGHQTWDGYVFCGCSREHPLLREAREARLPHVRISSDREPGSWDACINPAEGDRLVFQHLAAQGIRQVGLIMIEDQTGPIRALAQSFGIDIHILVSPGAERLLSKVEASGYRLGLQLLTSNPDLEAWYICDDILARGASRVLLGASLSRPPSLFVRTSKQQVVPLGLSTSYALFDMVALARDAATLFDDSLTNRAAQTYCLCTYELQHKSPEAP